MLSLSPLISLRESTRFKDQFFEMQHRLILKSNIVFSFGLFGHSGGDRVWTCSWGNARRFAQTDVCYGRFHMRHHVSGEDSFRRYIIFLHIDEKR